MDIKIRTALIGDLDALVNFNQSMARETENKELDSKVLESGVAALINDRNKGFYLVAEQDSQVVGSLMVTNEWSDWRNAVFWWIQSVYILPQYRRKGLYAMLYEEVKLLAKQEGNVCGWRLYVEKDNIIAQMTYKALGMNESHYLMFEES
ncbi:MAG: ribosomal protein S18 acetylase RimI-like enzyme [Paraglaciecola sp.]|jgi:ribosomal protein S18 acetylase RimI-like enzyme